MEYSAGNHGEGVRSDCFINLKVTKDKGTIIDLKSKVRSIYGESILDLCRDELRFFGIKNARLEIDDNGALPFVIAARLEAAIKKHLKTDNALNSPPLKTWLRLQTRRKGKSPLCRQQVGKSNHNVQNHGALPERHRSRRPERRKSRRQIHR